MIELFEFSMAEKPDTVLDWRVTLPEPARSYAESKLQKERGIDYLAPQVLDFYQGNFCDKVLKHFDTGENNKGQQLLLQENSNLVLFLKWGCDHERSSDQICRSARITASLSPYWRWIEPNQDPLERLNLALAAAQRNQDKKGEDLVKKAIAALASRGEFKDVQTLGQESAEDYIEDLGNGINLDMIAIPGGKFLMGTEDKEIERLCKEYNMAYFRAEKPQHEVTVQPFALGKYPITQAQYRQVMGVNPSHFNGDNLPVECVSWDDAVKFCQKLSEQTGKEYRLPSEAEWEYAARAGTTTPYHFGETITDKLANYGNKVGKTTSVGEFPPNAFGLYDMHGNVWEWCQDNWHDNYEGAPTNGSAWLSGKVL